MSITPAIKGKLSPQIRIKFSKSITVNQRISLISKILRKTTLAHMIMNNISADNNTKVVQLFCDINLSLSKVFVLYQHFNLIFLLISSGSQGRQMPITFLLAACKR
jgi:hypothetical protein